tara:strand:+ start:902 stop:2242 length:1341 start_codon:yes stop_codon:yes gene_type:complete
MKLTNHEKTILDLIKNNPDIIDNSNSRRIIAQKHGYTEKTLRNRIGDLKKYGFINNIDFKDNDQTIDRKDELNIIDLIMLFWANKIFTIKLLILSLIFSISLTLSLPITYRATSVLMHPSGEQDSGLLSSLSQLPLAGLFQAGKDESMDFLAILKSRTVMQSVIDQFDLVTFYSSDNNELALDNLRNNVNLEIDEEGTISISVNVSTGWFHPENQEEGAKKMCSEMANFFVKRLDEVNKGLKIKKASFQRLFIEKRYKDNLKDLKIAEDNLRNFQEKYKMISLPEQTNAAIQAAADIKAQQLSSEVQLGVLSKVYNSNHPDVVTLKNEVSELGTKLKEMDFGIGSFDNNELFPAFNDVPELGMKLMRLSREVEIQNTLFSFLTQQYEDAKIQEAKNTPTVQILDYAVHPELKYKPKRARIVIFFFMLTLFSSFYYLYFEKYNLNRF